MEDGVVGPAKACNTQDVHSINDHDPAPLDDFMEAISLEDPVAAIKAIDEAVAAGADIHDPYIQPLCVAARNSNLAIIKQLIAIGCTMTSEWPAGASTDPTADVDRGDCALQVAAANGRLDVLELLLAMPDAPRFMRAFDNDYISLSPLAWPLAKVTRRVWICSSVTEPIRTCETSSASDTRLSKKRWRAALSKPSATF